MDTPLLMGTHGFKDTHLYDPYPDSDYDDVDWAATALSNKVLDVYFLLSFVTSNLYVIYKVMLSKPSAVRRRRQTVMTLFGLGTITFSIFTITTNLEIAFGTLDPLSCTANISSLLYNFAFPLAFSVFLIVLSAGTVIRRRDLTNHMTGITEYDQTNGNSSTPVTFLFAILPWVIGVGGSLVFKDINTCYIMSLYAFKMATIFCGFGAPFLALVFVFVVRIVGQRSARRLVVFEYTRRHTSSYSSQPNDCISYSSGQSFSGSVDINGPRHASAPGDRDDELRSLLASSHSGPMGPSALRQQDFLNRQQQGGESRGIPYQQQGGESRGIPYQQQGGESRGIAYQQQGGESRGIAYQHQGGESRGIPYQYQGGESRGIAYQQQGGESRGIAYQQQGGESRGIAYQHQGGESRGIAYQQQRGESRGIAYQQQRGESRGLHHHTYNNHQQHHQHQPHQAATRSVNYRLESQIIRRDERIILACACLCHLLSVPYYSVTLFFSYIKLDFENDGTYQISLLVVDSVRMMTLIVLPLLWSRMSL